MRLLVTWVKLEEGRDKVYTCPGALEHGHPDRTLIADFQPAKLENNF